MNTITASTAATNVHDIATAGLKRASEQLAEHRHTTLSPELFARVERHPELLPPPEGLSAILCDMRYLHRLVDPMPEPAKIRLMDALATMVSEELLRPVTRERFMQLCFGRLYQALRAAEDSGQLHELLGYTPRPTTEE